MLDAVRLLSAGYCTHPEAMTRRGAPWQSCTFPSGFALLSHPRHGAILFDTGYSERFVHETQRWPGTLYARVTPVHIGASESAKAQLAALGVAAREVRTVVVSHFHADHLAGLRDFPSARIVCSRAAWESVRSTRGLGAVLKGFLPGLLPDDIEARLQFVETFEATPLDGPSSILGAGWDVFGDASVLAIALPGHAAGHIGLFVQRSAGGPMLLVGDAAWSLQAIESVAAPPRITTAFLRNTRAYRETLQRLHALRRALPALPMVVSHGAQALQAAPG